MTVQTNEKRWALLTVGIGSDDLKAFKSGGGRFGLGKEDEADSGYCSCSYVRMLVVQYT